MNIPAVLLPRRLVIALGLIALVIAWITMADIAEATPWYRHAEANLPALTDALALNTGATPARIGEPGLLPSYLLALDWRFRHWLGMLPAWNIPTLGSSANPVSEMRTLVRLELIHSRMLVILLILGGGAVAWAVVPGLESAGLTVTLLCGAAGLLYHGLIVQPELLGCGLGGVLALLCLWHGTTAPSWRTHHLGLFLAGLGSGIASLAQASGIFYLLMSYAWCWLAALTTPSARPGRPGLQIGLLPAASAILLLWLAQQASATGATTAVVAERLRALALLAGLLPMLTLWDGEGRRWGTFLRDRACEFALLGGGALAALVLAYGALLAVLPAEAALVCWAGQLEQLFYPGPFMENLLTAPAGIGRDVIRFVGSSPFLYATSAVLTLILGLQREVPVRTRAFLGLLLVSALGSTWLLVHGRNAESASVGVQVSLLLLCSIALLATGPWPHLPGRHPWLFPVILVASAVLLATAPLRLRVIAPRIVAADNPAVSGYTLTYLFDHHAHPPAFRQMMQARFTDRAGFEQALRKYLADPAHRY